jgi:hypothetical protein
VATVIAAVVATAAFAWSAKTDLEAARTQTQATALEILQSQLQLAIEHPDLATADPADPATLADPRYGWYAMSALVTAETIYGLMGTDPRWRAAAGQLVAQHQAFVQSPAFDCDLFSADFLTFVREVIGEEGGTVCPAI